MNLQVMTERHGMEVEMKDPGDTGERNGKGVKNTTFTSKGIRQFILKAHVTDNCLGTEI